MTLDSGQSVWFDTESEKFVRIVEEEVNINELVGKQPVLKSNLPEKKVYSKILSKKQIDDFKQLQKANPQLTQAQLVEMSGYNWSLSTASRVLRGHYDDINRDTVDTPQVPVSVPNILKKLTPAERENFRLRFLKLCGDRSFHSDFSLLFREFGLSLEKSSQDMANLTAFYGIDYQITQPSRRQLTDMEVKTVITRYDEGYPTDYIASILKCNVSDVYEVTNGRDAWKGKHQAGRKVVRLYEVARMQLDGHSMSDMARYYGINEDVMQEIYNKFFRSGEAVSTPPFPVMRNIA
jgi:hypothetical protein